jgi:hypothetical protein
MFKKLRLKKDEYNVGTIYGREKGLKTTAAYICLVPH